MNARLLKRGGVTVRCQSRVVATIVKKKLLAIFAVRNVGKIGKNTSTPSGSAVADFNVCYCSLNAMWNNLETIMMIQRPMHRIYAKIINAGFNQDSINQQLPAWWDEDLAETPAGAQYARLYLARIFSLAPESLKDESSSARFFSQIIPSRQALDE